MALKPLLWKLSLTLSASFAAATSFNLSSEITRLVPPCARECFRSHLSANYALTTCGSAPSLQCLCANVGFSGLTIGEGAVQCIVAEKSIGFCRESDAPLPGAEEANSEPSERLGTGQVAGLAVGLVAALGLAILAICLARRKRRRDYPDVKTGFFPVREKDSWEFHPQEGPANIFHISPPVHHAQSPPPPPRPPPATRARTSGRTSWWPGAIGLAVSRSESPSTALRPPPPQQDRPTSRLLPAKPSLASPKPVLSLKIPQIDLSSSSPPQPQEQRGSQPTNSQIFKTAKLTAPPKSHYNARESTMTEFEEDGAITSARSALSNNIWRPPSATVGNNPKSATFYVADKNGNWVLGDPKSAAHMAQIAELDASGASEGGGAKVKPSYAESAMLAATATTAGMGHGAGSPVAPSAARMPPPPLLLPAAEIVRSGALTAPPAAHQSRSSSVYSQGTTRPNTGIQTAGVPQAGGAPHPVPSMSFSHPEPPHRRSNSLGRRSSLKSKPGTVSTVPATAAASSTFNAPKRSDSHDSHASATTIASSVASSEPEPVIEQSSLSPVVESPASNASPSGRSPVSYPAIPGRTSSKPRNDNLRLLAPPTRTYGGFPPGQPSPTLGMMQQQRQQARDAPSMASYDVPRKPVARPRPAATDPNRVATGSPSLRLVTPSPPAEAGSLQQEPHWKPAQTQRPPQMRPLYPPPLQPQRPRIESSNFHPQPLAAQPTALPEQSPPPRQPLPERPSSASPSPHHVATQALRPAPNFTPTPAPSSSSSSKTGLPPRPPSPQAASPSVATPSTTSSLLSKRLGSERAAALALPTAGIRHSPNWRPHRPGRAAGAGGGTDMLLSPDAFFPAPPGFPSRSGAGAGDLPSTPTWQPKLTPTRRGDDLFLNVQ
ncbi:def1-like protein [Colletotrichum tofieldiae]|nr:def1-like protein [Colletotrichum tofieldiae]